MDNSSIAPLYFSNCFICSSFIASLPALTLVQSIFAASLPNNSTAFADLTAGSGIAAKAANTSGKISSVLRKLPFASPRLTPNCLNA